MLKLRPSWRALMLSSGFVAGLLAPALPGLAAGGRASTVLETLEPGLWELRNRGATTAGWRLCLSSGRDLVRLRHPRLECSQVVVEDRPGEITVQYTCPGHGYGRTSIRRETGRLVQMDTQGIIEGMPFALSLEARRVSECHS